jgi:DNA uptake protein ComE-like DNA-binding protein/predicted regulator of Ras-like GTPase activity (Roadblock/LC7/MglB family)
MRLPFFRSSKAEPTQTVVAPPSPAPRAQLAETQLIGSTDDGTESASPAHVRRASATVSSPPAGNGASISIPLNCIFQQLPNHLLAPTAQEQIASATMRVPADWVLPQLSSGKVTFPLAKLLPLLPQNILRNPVPVINNQHAIVLPLEEVVTALPADLLTHQDQTTLDIDTPEFNKLPKLFDDDDSAKAPAKEEPAPIVAAQTPAPVAATETREEVVPLAPPPPAFFVAPSPVLSQATKPASKDTTTAAPTTETPPKPTPAAQQTGETSPQPAPAAPQTGDDNVMVTLRSLVAVMPDHVFVCPRTELWQRVDLDSRVPLPRDVVLPQLQIARVRIPLAVAVAAMPASILASPLPSIGNETIPLALQEIVSQLPSGLFATAATQSDEETLDFSESEIPMPFKEKIFAAEEPEVVAAESTETLTPEPEVESKVFEVSTEVFADEGLSIFAEKAAATEEPVAVAEVQSQPEPKPEPVAETPAPSAEPIPEATPPVAEITSAEPVAELPAEANVETSPAPSEIVSPAPTAIEATVPSEQPAAPIESTAEPVAVPTSTAEIPAAPEIAHEVITPVEQPATPTGAAPIENKFLLNLNQCTIEDLAKVEGVDPALAQRIIEFRTAQGGFKSPKELRHVPGINRKALRTLTGPAPRALNRLLNIEHNEELTLQEIVRLTSQLKGVSGCILAMSDGVFLTGQLPPHLDQETISVFAPQLFKKVGRYMKELRVGQITRLSVFTDQQPLSIFHAGDVFLVVIHDPSHFSKALLRRCERISQEIARLFRQRAVV